jgi:arsenate reductase
MGCEESCPAVLAKKIIEWEIPDPKGKSIDVFREVRDLIEDKVRDLFKQVGGFY